MLVISNIFNNRHRLNVLFPVYIHTYLYVCTYIIFVWHLKPHVEHMVNLKIWSCCSYKQFKGILAARRKLRKLYELFEPCGSIYGLLIINTTLAHICVRTEKYINMSYFYAN